MSTLRPPTCDAAHPPGICVAAYPSRSGRPLPHPLPQQVVTPYVSHNNNCTRRRSVSPLPEIDAAVLAGNNFTVSRQRIQTTW